jgi:general secretion pathway protein E/type IV pilus assembly protein PilB
MEKKEYLTHLISSDLALKYEIIPVSKKVNQVTFITHKVSKAHDGLNDLNLLTGFNCNLLVESEQTVTNLLNKYYYSNSIDKGNSFTYSLSVEDLVQEAKSLRASDIHIEAYEDLYRIRFRIDGILIERHSIKAFEFNELVNKIKIEAEIDITEKRLPQDGRIRNKKMDLRVNVLPTLHGEKVVLRLLGNDATGLKIENLGFNQEDLLKFKKAITKPNGIILISGPTGSGKTTTLYAALNELNTVSKNIVTIEDPVEYTLTGINQVQLKEEIGLNFEAALRSFLRQDPDIIMLGEIRDSKTASMAMRASLTGHLVLSTIHTNSAAGIISRLIDMGIPTFLIADTINLAIAQRLIRKLCEKCKIKLSNDEIHIVGQITDANLTQKELYKSQGCSNCNFTGYNGRIAIYDLLELTEGLKAELKKGDFIISETKSKLYDKALNLFISGETSMEEIQTI